MDKEWQEVRKQDSADKTVQHSTPLQASL